MKSFSAVEEIDYGKGYSTHFALFSGVLAVLVVGLLLDLLGMAIGLSLFSPAKKVMYSLSIGAVIWVVCSTIASTYLGGWTASYFSSPKVRRNGLLNGFIVSSLSIFIFMLLTYSTVGMIVSSSLSGLKYALSATKENTEAMVTTVKDVSDFSPKLGEKAKKAIPTLTPITNKIQQKAAELFSTDELLTEKIKSELETLIASYLNSIENSHYEKTKRELVSFLSEKTGKSSVEINQNLEEWKNDYIGAKEQAKHALEEASKEATTAVSQFALLNFFILMSGIISGMMGGTHGIRSKENC
ncbi:MAG TPA: hypothetical protein VNK03_02405 [Gammaproteobacteria bacterium]|nr:hypothetical protein [Gammaproteobacteria bacterium]